MTAECGGRKLTVGILGGMGPEATVDLQRRVIELTPATGDGDHIRMLVDCDPSVPSRIAAIIEGSGPSPAPALIAMARGLVTQGADFLCMPCNTAHHYFHDIASQSPVPMINLLEIAAERVHRAQPRQRRVGLLASTALQITSLYEPYFQARDKELLYPAPQTQERLMDLILATKGQQQQLPADILGDAAGQLINAGAQCLMIACTELSLYTAQLQGLPVAVFDTADLLAREVVDRALGGEAL